MFAIGRALLSKGLLVLGLDNKQLCRCIRYRELSFPQTTPNYYGRNLGTINRQSELLVTLALDLVNDLDNLRKRTNVTGWGDAAFGVEIKPSRIRKTLKLSE